MIWCIKTRINLEIGKRSSGRNYTSSYIAPSKLYVVFSFKIITAITEFLKPAELVIKNRRGIVPLANIKLRFEDKSISKC